jgi:hypothetical protein
VPEFIEPDLSEEEKALIAEAARQFHMLRQNRQNQGKEEYGEYTFLQTDTIRMMLEELADLMNYAEMSAVRIILAQAAMVEDVPTEKERGFVGTKEGWERGLV